MAPEHNMTEIMKSETSNAAEHQSTSTTTSSKMADNTTRQQDEYTPHSNQTESHSKIRDSDILNEFEGYNSYRTESTATDDSGIAAEFDYQTLDLDELNDAESELGNSHNDSLQASTSSSNGSKEDTDRSGTSSTDSSPRQELCGHVSRTRTKQLSTEDESLSPRQRWWSPHRAVCSDSLDSIAEEKRRSKNKISYFILNY